MWSRYRSPGTRPQGLPQGLVPGRGPSKPRRTSASALPISIAASNATFQLENASDPCAARSNLVAYPCRYTPTLCGGVPAPRVPHSFLSRRDPGAGPLPPHTYSLGLIKEAGMHTRRFVQLGVAFLVPLLA